MRALSAGLQDHLNSGATTLCWCWRITRNDGTAFGFTDHDRDIAFDGTLFEIDAMHALEQRTEVVDAWVGP